MRISDWSSDVCSSDLLVPEIGAKRAGPNFLDDLLIGQIRRPDREPKLFVIRSPRNFAVDRRIGILLHGIQEVEIADRTAEQGAVDVQHSRCARYVETWSDVKDQARKPDTISVGKRGVGTGRCRWGSEQ